MVLKFKDYETDININPNLGLVMPVDNDGGNEEMAGENTNLWDSIEVEMDAQFDTVKITLGELKSIEKGLVVDLTSIYDNKVTLSVENKPIARGELVIVNDRYGVKIDEVIAKTPKVENNQAAQMQNEEIVDTQTSDFDDSNMEFQEETPPAQSQNPDEDEFDYSDFELEDEDI